MNGTSMLNKPYLTDNKG